MVYEPAEEGGYIVYVPALPGCHSQGDTKAEARRNIVEAIELYLEDSKRHDEPVRREEPDLIGKVKVAV